MGKGLRFKGQGTRREKQGVGSKGYGLWVTFPCKLSCSMIICKYGKNSKNSTVRTYRLPQEEI